MYINNRCGFEVYFSGMDLAPLTHFLEMGLALLTVYVTGYYFESRGSLVSCMYKSDTLHTSTTKVPGSSRSEKTCGRGRRAR